MRVTRGVNELGGQGRSWWIDPGLQGLMDVVLARSQTVD